MALKTKTKSKSVVKPAKTIVGKAAITVKSSVRKGKTVPALSKPAAKKNGKAALSVVKKVEVQDRSKNRNGHPKEVPVLKVTVQNNGRAIQAYEAALKLMHAEEFGKAVKAFGQLIATHGDEPEIQERARVLMHVSEKRLHERSRTVLKSADDHYNMQSRN